jgi:hypothetical protein
MAVFCEHGNESSDFLKEKKPLDLLNADQLLKMDCLPCL